MENLLLSLADRLWPELKTLTEQRRIAGASEVIAFFWSLPFALAGLIWLAAVTDLGIIRQHWAELLLFLVLQLIFYRLSYFIIVQIRTDRYGSADGSLVGVAQWTAAFLFGPSALWVSTSWMLLNFIRNGLRSRSTSARWTLARTATHEIAFVTLASLVGLSIYQRWGGSYPLHGLAFNDILPAFGALLVQFAMLTLIWSMYLAFVIWTQRILAGAEAVIQVVKFMLLALGLSNLANPFAIQAAVIYTQNGMFGFLFFISGLLIVAVLGRQLSWAVESSRQRSRQVEQLEQLGRAIINAPSDASTLPQILEEHVPTMFPSARITIHIFPDRLLLKKPDDWKIDLQPVWNWGCSNPAPHAFLAKDPLPWGNPANGHDPVVVAPITAIENGSNIGCVYIELRSLAQPWDRRSLNSLFPAAKTLADQVASALHQAQVYESSLKYEHTLQELEFAGRIQASFLPTDIPTLDGWEFAVSLLPARQTSGDFFDFIDLPDGKLGLLIADVADKGVGAALYMALCRTLIRTYALEYTDAEPDVVFFATNERLLKDAHANIFVTAFYGILDPVTNSLTYCNAGHNPPYLFCCRKDSRPTPLSATGMPLGIEEDEVWKKVTIQIDPGDVLVVYTDGVPDAQNEAGDFFRERRLADTARSYIGLPAQEMLISIIEEIRRFTGDAPQFDDMTMLVVRRNE